LTDVSTAKSLFIGRETVVWGSLWFLRAAPAEANERLAQWSTEVADLRLLCDELEVEAAAARAEAASARTEAQQRQLELGHVIGEWDQSRSQAAEAVGRAEALGGQLAEVSARARALVEDLTVAVGSAQSAQAAASEQRARAEGMFRPLCDFDSASFFNSCLKNVVWLSVEFKALAQAAEQKEADRVAMSKAISAFCQVFGLDNVPSGSSPQSRLRALGGHVRSRLREALHHDVRRPSPCSLLTTTWIWSGSARGNVYPTKTRLP
jgi:outer membrane murein-binding lipoprotein Lpp